jgi:hypothetical protein
LANLFASRKAARRSAASLVLWTIFLGTTCRLLVAAIVPDLGHSEAYYIATSRHVALSYFDHPPLSFWIAWAAMKLTGSDAVLAVRTPFILMFVATTWLTFRFTALLFGEAAGALAALLLNISPLFAISLGAWVQPDGPLLLFLLAASYCIVRLAYDERLERPLLLWAQAGLWLGLALLSKYYAVLLPVGIVLFAATSQEHRRWFREPGPYIACATAILVFSPVLIWNWQNDWISFGFQGRHVVESHGITVQWLLESILGQAMLIGPWIWIPMLLSCTQPARDGRTDSRSWLVLCIACVPILLFTLIALWVSPGGHYHWQAPGYLMLFPLLGKFVAQKLESGDVHAKRWLGASIATMFLIIGIISANDVTGWSKLLTRDSSVGQNLTLKGLEWKELRSAVAARGLLEKSRLFVVTSHRLEIGKVDMELGGSLPVTCLCPDPRNVAFGWDPSQFSGWDALIIGTRQHIPDVQQQYGKYFRTIEPLDEVTVHHGGGTALILHVYYAKDYLGTYPSPFAHSSGRTRTK